MPFDSDAVVMFGNGLTVTVALPEDVPAPQPPASVIVVIVYVVVANGLTGIEASVVHNLWLGYEEDWLPTSRGTSPDDLAKAINGFAGAVCVPGRNAGTACPERPGDRAMRDDVVLIGHVYLRHG